MTPTTAIPAPVESFTVEANLPAECPEATTVAQAPPSPEQLKAVEAVFSEQQEADRVIGLLGIWTSTVLLRDLALDAFAGNREDEEEEEGKPGLDPAP